MQYRYLGEVELSLSEKQELEKIERKTLLGLLEMVRIDLQEAARLFGSNSQVLLEKLRKYHLL